MKLTLSFDIGATRMTLRELLELQEGSVVKLSQPAGAFLTVRVNRRFIGQAEVVVAARRASLRIYGLEQ